MPIINPLFYEVQNDILAIFDYFHDGMYEIYNLSKL